jgi:hypothetical protein
MAGNLITLIAGNEMNALTNLLNPGIPTPRGKKKKKNPGHQERYTWYAPASHTENSNPTLLLHGSTFTRIVARIFGMK